MSYVQVAVGVAKFAGALEQGKVDKMNANTQNMLLNAQAQQEEAAGVQQAQIIRRARDYAVGAADAAYAASGVKVGEGSAAEVDAKIDTDGTYDAYMAVLNGQRRASQLRLQGTLGTYGASSAATQGEVSALASGVQSVYSGWKTAPKTAPAGAN